VIKFRFLVLFLLCCLLLPGCAMFNMRLTMGAPNINSWKSFGRVSLPRSTDQFCFYEVKDRNALGDQLFVRTSQNNGNPITLADYLREGPTVAFSIIRNDTVLYEYYAENYDESSIVSSFSVSKALVGITLGCAIQDGFIKSAEDSIVTYLPELRKKKGMDKIKIRHLMNHISGLKFGTLSFMYYKRNLCNVKNYVSVFEPPGTRFSYNNGNTQLVSIIIERASGKKFQEYFAERIWTRIGSESEMTWSIDNKKSNTIKSFCCMAGLNRDFAKLGKLMLQKGKWNGKEIFSESWYNTMIKWDLKEGSAWDNEFGWWMGPKDYGYYYAAGLWGQYVIVYPKKNIIITRFAKLNIERSTQVHDRLMMVMDQL
jgi:CubicO group peptidase (beta-lactamase class C family)